MATRYATLQDIRDEFGDRNVAAWMERSSIDGLTEADLAYVDRQINWAESRIDAHLSPVAVTPFTDTSLTLMADLLREWVVDLAAGRLATRTATQDAGLKDRVDGVRDDLKAILDGEMRLPTGVALTASIGYGFGATTQRDIDGDLLSLDADAPIFGTEDLS